MRFGAETQRILSVFVCGTHDAEALDFRCEARRASNAGGVVTDEQRSMGLKPVRDYHFIYDSRH